MASIVQNATTHSLPSPTLTNPDMVLPNEVKSRLPSSPPNRQRPPSPSYLLEHVRNAPAEKTAQLTPRKSLGSMSQRLALQRSATFEDNPASAGAVQSPTENASQETIQAAKDSEIQQHTQTSQLKQKKSLGSMSQRLALQRATTDEDSHFQPSAPAAIRSQDSSQETLRPDDAQSDHLTTPPQIQRKGSFNSVSTTSLDWDSIPEYKYDGELSEADTLDYAPSGTATPSRRSVGDETATSVGTPQNRDRTSSKSSAELSRRAELILANAKKRLNLMDQNLKGARALTAENLQRAASLTAHRSPYSNRFFGNGDESESSDSPQGHRVGHMRNRSDNTLITSNVRSRTALAGETLREDEEDSDAWPTTPLRGSKSQELPQTRTLKSMRFASKAHLRPRTTSSPLGMESSASAPDGKESSSPATTQLKQQVQNLNRRISMLKERTMEDSLRRQSLQNVRQPNPLTDANPSQKGLADDAARKRILATIKVQAPSPNQSRWSVDSSVKRLSVLPERPGSPTSIYSRSPNGGQLRLSKRQSKSKSKQTDWSPIIPQHADQQVSRFSADSEAAKRADGATDDEVNGAEEVISDEGTPHEERQDAFDYQNFFLHSTLGGVSRMSDSSSEASDDTARAPLTDGQVNGKYETPEKLQQIERGLHKRFSSLDSLSSDASFATAREGLRSKQVSPIKAAQAGSDGADSGVGVRDTAKSSGATLTVPTGAKVERAPSPIKAGDGQSVHKRQLSSHIAAQVKEIAAPPSAIAVAALTLQGKKALGLKDRAMVFMLMDSTRRAVERLQDAQTPPNDARILRRRIEEARKVMDGIAPVVTTEDIA